MGEDQTPRIGTGGGGGVLLKGFGAVSFAGGLACIVAAIVNLVRFGDRAGAIGGTAIGLFFVLSGRYLWRVPGRPVVELTDDGVIFHADVDPGYMLFTRMRRTVVYRWEDIEAIDVRPTRVGMTIWLRLDGDPSAAFEWSQSRLLRPRPRRASSRISSVSRPGLHGTGRRNGFRVCTERSRGRSSSSGSRCWSWS